MRKKFMTALVISVNNWIQRTIEIYLNLLKKKRNKDLLWNEQHFILRVVGNLRTNILFVL